MGILSKWADPVNGKWVLFCTYRGNQLPNVVVQHVENKFIASELRYNFLLNHGVARKPIFGKHWQSECTISSSTSAIVPGLEVWENAFPDLILQ